VRFCFLVVVGHGAARYGAVWRSLPPNRNLKFTLE
jgi:hypothetical protein